MFIFVRIFANFSLLLRSVVHDEDDVGGALQHPMCEREEIAKTENEFGGRRG